MFVRRMIRNFLLILVVAATVLLLAPEWSAMASEESRLQSIVGLLEYDFLVWETDAFLNKGETAFAEGQKYLDEKSRKAIVLEYLGLVRRAQVLEAELNQAYSDPDILNPELETLDLQHELRETRKAIEQKQLLVEAIVQEQVALVLTEEGFDVLGQAWPPVLIHVTEVPSLLVVSPRDRIEKIHQVTLEHGLTTPSKERLESAVTDKLDHSALVVPLGGIGTYPAMIVETSDINRLVEVVVHEWVHHWLTLKPLGFNYAFDPDVRIINETVASLVDQELGRMVVERFYPELLSPEPPDIPDSSLNESEPPEFDFSTELSNTRIEAEKLLAEGRIEEAEAYMEERRRDFRDEGYIIRKLNQAFFAFYGAYAAEPGGAQGGNPIGPMLREIRDHTPSARAFLEAVAPITSFAKLQEVHARIVPSTSE